MSAVARDLDRVLGEAVGHLAYVATERHYAEQPALWELGEWGRARTLEDYEHHFRRLAQLDEAVWSGHLEYCEQLWAARDFPRRWLTDAFRIMDETLRAEIGDDAAAPALALLRIALERTA